MTMEITNRRDDDARQGTADIFADIAISDIFGALLRNWWMIIVGIIIGILAGILFLHLATYKYTARLNVTPVESSGDLSANRLSGLASIAGVSLPKDQSGAQFSLYLEGMLTREVAEVVSRDRKLMGALFEKGWNESIGDWREPSGPIADAKLAIKQFLGFPILPWRKPDASTLEKFVNEELSIHQDPERMIVSISLEHKDPELAVRLLGALSAATDNILRQRSLARSEAAIAHISQKLGTVSQIEHRTALATMLGHEERTYMMASSPSPFSAEPFGNVEVSPVPTAPRPLIVLIISIFLGASVGGAIILFRLVFQRDRGSHLVPATPI